MTRGRLTVAAVLLAVAALVAGFVLVERRADERGAGAGPGTETVVVEGPRGRILDRTGKVLVEGSTVLQIRADRDVIAALPEEERYGLATALAEVIVLDEAERRPPSPGIARGAPTTASSLVERLSADDDAPVLATGVGEAVRGAIEADPDAFPGVTVEPLGARTYAYGALAAHVLGYTGRATEEERDRLDLPDGIETVGKSGIERAMDAELRGEPGRVVYELDDDGQRVRELTDLRTEPTRGRDVYLTLDINLQYLVEKGLAAEVERRRGRVDSGCYLGNGCDPQGAASVAVDPRNGEVLAMASYPTYDPMLFAGGVSVSDWEAIADDERGDEHRFPLLNRAISGQYAPASTLKPFTAYAALATELITPAETYDDTGIYRYRADCPIEQEDNSCSARNAGATPHGAVDLADALRVSSDTYFYALGDESWRARDRIGEEALQEGIEDWGFGAPTEIDLVGEQSGRVPTPTWRREFSDRINADTPEMAEEAGRWTPSVSGNLAVGQGDALVTPLQLASGYAALANGGTIWRPRLVGQTTAYGGPADVTVPEPEATGEVELPAGWRDPMIAGLDGVTKGPGGTATTAFSGFDQSDCPVMGKTGTGQATGRNDSSLFVAVAPTPTEGRESVIALATVFQEAGFGASAAVPLARRVLEPLASVGCDLARFGAADSPFTAPLGGWFDVAGAQAEYIPPEAATSD